MKVLQAFLATTVLTIASISSVLAQQVKILGASYSIAYRGLVYHIKYGNCR